MAEIVNLPLIDNGDVTSALLLVCYDTEETGSKSKRIALAQLLAAYPATGTDAEFNDLDLTGALAGTSGAFNTVAVATSLQFVTGATMTGLRRVVDTVATGAIAANSANSVTVALSGAVVGDHVSLSFQTGLTAGVLAQAWVSAPDTVTIRFHNTTTGIIGDTSYTASVVAMRFA